MIKDNGLSFKDLEKKIYEWGCQICRECHPSDYLNPPCADYLKPILPPNK